MLSSTLPATLAAQGVITDPDTGLVYLGDGRFYDPALGRPLQPNPAGGPPTVPQALNRYTATEWGQPGVAEGAINGGSFDLLPYLPYAASTAKIWAYDFHYSPQIGQALAHVMPLSFFQGFFNPKDDSHHSVSPKRQRM